MKEHYLKTLFEPKSVALFGASEKNTSLARFVLESLQKSKDFSGTIHLINPKHKRVFGKLCYASVKDINSSIDLAIIATPAKTLSTIIEQCGKKGIKYAIVLSNDFGGNEQDVEKREQQLAKQAYRRQVRLLGPNSLGIIRPKMAFNASLYDSEIKTGNIALVSQSGAICTAILDWANQQNIGFSSVISLGDASDIDFGEILDYLLNDEATQSIILYIEGVKNARAFMSGLRAASRIKPVIAIKAGRYSEASIAARRHSGAMVGADDVYHSALRRAGVVRGNRINDMFVAARVLSLSNNLSGQNLCIITNGGGPGVIASDNAGDHHVPLTSLSKETITKLNSVLPEQWSRHNPIDIRNNASPSQYQKTLEICLEDPDIHGILVILAPHAMIDPMSCCEKIIEVVQSSSQHKKIVLTCWMGGNKVTEARRKFSDVGIPTFSTPEASIAAFSYLTSFYRNQKLLLQTPPPRLDDQKSDIAKSQQVIKSALKQNRNILNPEEAQAILYAFNIRPNGHAYIHTSSNPIAEAISQVKVGIFTDPIFGPIIYLSVNGSTPLREESREVSLPPLNAMLAKDIISRSSIFNVLQSFELYEYTKQLENILISISEMACELEQLKALDLNPFRNPNSKHIKPLVRMVVSRKTTRGYYSHMAIHPYPSHWVIDTTLRDGSRVTIRPIRGEDAQIEKEFFDDLSQESRYFRFMYNIKQLTPQMVSRFTQIDYDREMALVAEHQKKAIGIARYVKNPDATTCEFAIVVGDSFQHLGIGRMLMAQLIQCAQEEKLSLMEGTVLSENKKMLSFCRSLGFTVSAHPEEASEVLVTKPL